MWEKELPIISANITLEGSLKEASLVQLKEAVMEVGKMTLMTITAAEKQDLPTIIIRTLKKTAENMLISGLGSTSCILIE